MFEAPGEQIWYCPFCQKQTIKVHYNPSHRAFKTARGSGVSNTISVHKNQSVTMLSENCSNCGKTQKEIAPRL